MMKIITLFLLAGCMQLSAKMEAQGLSFSLSNVPISTAFIEIQQQTSYRFVYTNEQLSTASKITLSVQNVPLEKVLELCFKDQPLTWSIEDKFIIVKTKEKKIIAAPPAENDIRGKVSNDKGEPVSGATISLKGTQKGTATDSKGEFLLAEIPYGSVVVISSIGYESQEILIGNNRFLSIHMATSVSALDEMVIKGYYSTTKRLNTGSVSKVTADEISKQPAGDPIGILEGRVPGLFVQQSSGAPGSAFSVQLRGTNSIASGNSPLYIVDGVPFTSTSLTTPGFFQGADAAKSPFNSINPADIESIEVLKDADATAIYGSRGSNGVVLITTKKAIPGKNNINMNVYRGTGKVTRMMDLLNTKQYLSLRREAFKNDGVLPNTNTGRDLLVWDTTRYTDWQKVFIGGTAAITDAQISLTGGNNNTQFLIGGGYRRETTVYPGAFSDTRGSLHVNLTNTSSNKKLKTIFSASYSSDVNKLPQVDLIKYTRLSPDAPSIYNSNGKLNWENSTWNNPFSYVEQKFKSVTDNLISNLQISYSLLKDLSIKCSFAYNSLQMDQLVTSPLYSNDPAYISFLQAEADFGNNRIKTWITEPQIDYQKTIGKNTFNILLGATFQENKQQSLGQIGTGFSNDALLENIKAASTVITTASTNTLYRYNGFYARINYNRNDQYLLNLTGRRDGSSRFGPGRQFANFGAIGAAWIFSKQPFIIHHLPFISFGKLRGSFGITGNDQIGDYQYLSTYSPYSYPYLGVTGFYPTNLLNPDYGWETNKKIEAAVELGFLKNRVSLTVSYYRNRSSNQLVAYALPAVTGFSSIIENQPALIQNKGFELELNTINIINKNFRWSSSFNISFPRNKLISYTNFNSSSYQNYYAIGYSLNIRKVYHYLNTNVQTGIYQFEKMTDHTPTSVPHNPEDYVVKDMSVKYYGGFSNSLTYKNWSLDLLWQFVKQPAVNYLSQFITPGQRENEPTIVLDHWMNLGDISSIQKYSQTTGPAFSAWKSATRSDYSITDGSFIRFKSFSISYQLPDVELHKLKLQHLKVYLQGQNILTVTRYLGYDPENSGALPPLRMVTGGIQLTL